jgi:two-component sensor histidine kinase
MTSAFSYVAGSGAARSDGWPDGLVALQTTADGVLGLSLIVIPALLLYLLSRSDDRSATLTALTWLVSAAMFASGIQNLAAMASVWLPLGWLEGGLKLIAAVFTALVAFLLWQRMRGFGARGGAGLEREAAAHLLTKEELKETRAELKSAIDAHHREMSEAQHRFEIALRNSPITVLTQDTDLRFTAIHNPPRGIEAADLIGKTDADILPATVVDQIVAAKRKAMQTLKTQEIETTIETSRHSYALYLLIEPLQDANGKPTGVITVSVDVSQRKAQEMQLRMLLRELTHRSKNLLAVINAIARQTALRSPSLEEFLVDFNARLVSIGAAHDLLVADDWKGASLRTLVAAEIAVHTFARDAHIDIEGEDVMLKPEAVQNVGMALHELLANARKYGALSNPEGHVRVSWSSADGAGLLLTWEESGGPVVPRPDHFGFGRTVIENVVSKALEGEVNLAFEPTGVRCEIQIPPSQIRLA